MVEMRIVLTETSDEQERKREFKQIKISLGRDPLRNNVVFHRERWPTVSRRHAEIRFDGGRWYVADLNSSHGTLLNGQKISGVTEIQTGSQIQLGPEGPCLTVQVDEPPVSEGFMETFVDSEAAREQAAFRARAQQPAKIEPPPPVARITSPPVPSAQASAVQPARSPLSPAAGASPASLIFEGGLTAQIGGQFELKNEKTLIGRDEAADISIDAGAAIISRRHALIVRQSDGSFVVADLKSFNGTLVNDRCITQPTILRNGDRVQLAPGGPVFRFIQEADVRLKEAAAPAKPVPASIQPTPTAVGRAASDELGLKTITTRSHKEHFVGPAEASGARRLFDCLFDGKPMLSVGRGSENDIQLDGLLISKTHANFYNTPRGVMVQDAGSTNGVYVNGGRIRDRSMITTEDVVQIGPFILKADPAKGIAVFDSRSSTRIDAIAVTDTIHTRGGQDLRNLLDEVSLSIEPNQFVGVLGPSGAGKSVLIKALNGMQRTTRGRVLVNNLDLYQHINLLKQSIGYVPQDDLIHRELSVYRTLYYVALMRFSRDVPANEIDQTINEVLDVTDLSEKRDVQVSQLSGGQRKRVSIAVELLTKPSVIFLDEPTSGLDPATEERIMTLFRQIAESGHTVILTTHAMENVRLFDRIVLLLRGKLIFYGTPDEALEFIGATNFIDLYSKLEAPLASAFEKLAPLPMKPTRAQQRTYEQQCEEIADTVAENWRTRFRASPGYVRYIQQPLSLVQQEVQVGVSKRRRHGIRDALRQWLTLVRRYAAVVVSDKWNLAILLGQAPVVGLLTYFVVGKNDPRDFPYFILALVSIWFGTSVAAREIVKERPIYERERMVNLGLMPYVASKVFVLSFIVCLQTILLFGTTRIFHYAGMMTLPGIFYGLPQLLVMALTGVVGIALGLFISALVRTSEVATSMVPLILIPQILFAGLITVPTGVARIIGATMPATWSFDEMKRLSSLDTLRAEGSDPFGTNQGRGLYQHIKDLNDENVKNARRQVDDYTKQISAASEENHLQEKLSRASSNRAVSPVAVRSPEGQPTVAPPSIPAPREVDENQSDYVSFKHPWGSLARDPSILLAMLVTLFLATMIALRARDFR
jgi:ABC transport system ATP-binding/permease protein